MRGYITELSRGEKTKISLNCLIQELAYILVSRLHYIAEYANKV